MTDNQISTAKSQSEPKYTDPGCAYCPATVRACFTGEDKERGPGFCPANVNPDGMAEARQVYDDPFYHRVAQESSRVEAEGYCQWTRVEEICQFAKKMELTKIGIATCISFVDYANTLGQILESHGFEVASACCKHDGIDKEEIGLRDSDKIRPGKHESMCNPISQARLLNDAGCQLNVVLGLCIGHDSMFFKHSEGLATTLVAKDRVLAHNPIGALELADT
jgi:uncharacterized metal-binding protein